MHTHVCILICKCRCVEILIIYALHYVHTSQLGVLQSWTRYSESSNLDYIMLDPRLSSQTEFKGPTELDTYL